MLATCQEHDDRYGNRGVEVGHEVGVPDVDGDRESKQAAAVVSVGCNTDDVLDTAGVEAATAVAVQQHADRIMTEMQHDDKQQRQLAIAGSSSPLTIINATAEPPLHVSPVSVQLLYLALCKLEGDTKRSRSLLSHFTGIETNLTVKKLHFKNTYIGGKGPMGVVMVKLLRECVNVTSVDFTQQYMSNEAIILLAEVMTTHPSLSEIILEDNFIEVQAAKKLLKAVQENCRITHLRFSSADVDNSGTTTATTAKTDAQQRKLPADTMLQIQKQTQLPAFLITKLHEQCEDNKLAMANIAVKNRVAQLMPLAPELLKTVAQLAHSS